MKMLTKQQIKNRKTWVEGLRSGKYKQTKGVLKDCNGYCCLGVAAEVTSIGFDEFGLTKIGASDTQLSEKEQALFGLTDYNQGTLMSLNDNVTGGVFHVVNAKYVKLTFEEIADVIEMDTMARAEGWSLLAVDVND